MPPGLPRRRGPRGGLGSCHVGVAAVLTAGGRSQEIFVQDWPYAGLDFRNDPDLVLPPGEQWDDAGMDFYSDPDMPLPARDHWDDGGMTLDFF